MPREVARGDLGTVNINSIIMRLCQDNFWNAAWAHSRLKEPLLRLGLLAGGGSKGCADVDARNTRAYSLEQLGKGDDLDLRHLLERGLVKPGRRRLSFHGTSRQGQCDEDADRGFLPLHDRNQVADHSDPDIFAAF